MKKIRKKLSLKKSTISNLEMVKINGGEEAVTVYGATCPNVYTCHKDNCPPPPPSVLPLTYQAECK